VNHPGYSLKAIYGAIVLALCWSGCSEQSEAGAGADAGDGNRGGNGAGTEDGDGAAASAECAEALAEMAKLAGEVAAGVNAAVTG